MLSICKLRQFYTLSCRDCVNLERCLNYRNNHNGLKPYEVEKKFKETTILAKKKKKKNGGF